MNLLVRHAGIEDVERIAGYNIKMAWETERRKLPQNQVVRGVRAVIDRPEYGFYLIALSEEQPVGSLMVTMEWSDWRNGIFWWIQSVYVQPEFRGRGVYRSLYDRVKQLAQDKGGVCGFRLYVEKENHVARNVYEKLGMSPTSYSIYEEILPNPSG
ncbi:GNAT family N-acetyltransferase [bacterium]|nr:GNAT family N-acetyltransferase [candidate division CSSED10-310 bacterium]